jgi:hypothetical protein
MSDFVHRTETDTYAHGRPPGKSGPVDLELTRCQRVLGVSASARYLGAALVAEGRALRLFAQRLAKDGPNMDRAIRTSVADLVRSHHPRTVVIVVPSETADAATDAVHVLLVEACRTLGVAPTRVGIHDVGVAHGLDVESVIEIARYMAVHDPVVASYVAPRGHGPRSEAERYWEHAALAAAATLALRHESTPSSC